MNDSMPKKKLALERGQDLEVSSGCDNEVEVPPKSYGIVIVEQEAGLAEVVLDMDKPRGLPLHLSLTPYPEPNERVGVSSEPPGLIEAVEVDTEVPSLARPRFDIQPKRPGETTLTFSFPETLAGVKTAQLPVKVRATPFVEIAAPKLVLVRKDYLQGKLEPEHQRLQVSVGVRGDFDGTGLLEVVDKGKVVLFDDLGTEVGEEVQLSGQDLNAGKVFSIEGRAPSAAVEGTELRLTLDGGNVPIGGPAVDKLTCVELTLQLFDAEETEQLDAAKLTPGALLDLAPEQEASKRLHLRLLQAAPDDFAGKLVIRVAGEPNVSLFAAKDASNRTLIDGSDLANQATDIWLEATALSEVKEDVVLEAGLADLEDAVGDRVHATVRATPSVEVDAPGIVLVQDPPPQEPFRLGATLRATGGPAFKGKAVMAARPPANINMYLSDGEQPPHYTLVKSGDEIPTERLATEEGCRLFVVGLQPAEKVELELKLTDEPVASAEPAIAELKSIALALEVYTCKTPEAEPAVYAEKLDPGRTLCKPRTGASERAKVVVKKPDDNLGVPLVLWVWDEKTNEASDRIAVYDQERDGALVEELEVHEDTTVWVEPGSASATMKDTSLRLGVKGLRSGEQRAVGDKAVFTVVTAALELSPSRSQEGVQPAPMAGEEKLEVGRFIHVQKGTEHGRAYVSLGPVAPADYDGKFCLHVVDAASGEPSSRVELFDADRPGGGPMEPGTALAKEGVKLWAQGKEASAALRDVHVRLAIKDHVQRCDEVALTVVQFSKLALRWKEQKPGEEAEEDKSHEVAEEVACADDFETNAPLKRVSWSVPARNELDVSAELVPEEAKPLVRWSVLPIKGAQEVSRTVPLEQEETVVEAENSDANAPLTAKLRADKPGKLNLRAFIPGNESGTFNGGQSDKDIDREPFIVANLDLEPAPRLLLKPKLKTAENEAAMPDETVIKVVFDDKSSVEGKVVDGEFKSEVDQLRGAEYRPTAKSCRLEIGDERALYFVSG